MLMTINETDKAMEQPIKDILESIESVGLRAFVYIEEENSMIKIKGNFSDDNAVNFSSPSDTDDLPF